MKTILLTVCMLAVSIDGVDAKGEKAFKLTPEWKAKIKELAPKKATVKPKKKHKVLLFSNSPGYKHWVIPHTVAVIEALSERTGAFELVVSDDVKMFAPDKLKEFDGVILNNTCPKRTHRNVFIDVLGKDKLAEAAALEKSLIEFVKNGGGLTAMHGAITFLNNSKEFSNLLGGSFDFHPAQQTVTLKLVEPDHPLLKAFEGKAFVHVDEPYLFKNAYADKNFRPLLEMDTSSLNCGKRQKAVQSDVRYTAWIKRYGKGRVFYCSPSHNAQSFENPALLRFVLDGIQYTLGDLTCEDSPKKKVVNNGCISELPAEFQLNAGDCDRRNSPVKIPLVTTEAAKSLTLRVSRNNKWVAVPCQIIPGNPRRLAFLIDALDAGKTQRYKVAESTAAVMGSMQVKETDATLALAHGDSELLQYNIKPLPAPEYAKKYRHVVERTGYVHPLRTLNGETLTAIYPKDHVHHMGLWHPWTKATVDGKEVDFWNLKKSKGTMRYAKTNWKRSGPVLAGTSIQQEHVVLGKADADDVVALNDTLTLVAWKPGSDGTGYLLDYVSTQSCADAKKVVLGPYRYSGFGFRGRLDWSKANSDYLTSDGKKRKGANFTNPRWCKIEGKTKTGTAGLLFMTHPTNVNYPEPIRTWDTNWTFFNFNPIQEKAITLTPGKSITFKYRMYVYDGTASAETCEALWKDFAMPVIIDVRK